MDPIAILTAIATLVMNPALGGGGMKKEQTFAMLMHLAALIRGGMDTAKALEAWSEEIQHMADNGIQPTSKDFDRWTSALDAALDDIADARTRLEASGDLEPQGGNPAPVETPALIEADKKVVEQLGDQPTQ